jgi:L-asparaginase
MTSLPEGQMSPRIAVIGTGGTISTPARDELDLHEYGEHAQPMEVDELLDRFSPVLKGYELLAVRFRTIDSVVMDPSTWLELHRCISETVEGDPSIAGVVVTHGTSTLEETAYFLHLSLKVRVPVVLVGAQRPPHALSSDTGINLLGALRVATASAARDSGVLVVMNDEVHCAREVTKSSNFALQAFRAPDVGMLGNVDSDGHVAIYRKPVRRHAPGTEFEISGIDRLPAVEIVYSYAGASGRPIAALIEEGCRGIVLAGMPPGRASPAQTTELERAASSGVLVVQCSRAGTGRIVQRSGDRAMGFVGADNLNPQKARILAMLALTRSAERGAIERMFAEY